MWTPYPELDAVLADFVAGVRDVLGENLCGVYLQGSFAVGDADEHSDVDFLVVTHGPLREGDPEALQALQERIFALPSSWAQHLEGSYVTRELIRRVDPERTPLLYFDNGATERAWDAHDNTAVVRWSLREHGIVLAGPDAKTLVDPISPAELRADVGASIREWQEWLPRQETVSRRAQGVIVLTFARALHTLELGRVGSKREAGEWALTAHPSWAELVQSALDDRPDPWAKVREPSDPALMARTRAFLDYVSATARGAGRG